MSSSVLCGSHSVIEFSATEHKQKIGCPQSYSLRHQPVAASATKEHYSENLTDIDSCNHNSGMSPLAEIHVFMVIHGVRN